MQQTVDKEHQESLVCLAKQLSSKYCGIPWCNTCLIKKRAFPNKPNDRHDICDNCSHKFFVLQLYQEYSVKANSKDKVLKDFEAKYQAKKEEYLKLRAQHNKRKKEVRSLSYPISSKLQDINRKQK
eukprot:TRINITY_DN64620_c0_g1_i1.p7 TRINITY_DN64620_c0_g1~~TRINITY_DN64620_c0_g1_i1.p7  ORF type:complete len:126 (-),score=8.47 TRINITY_DN64620_c0_g1_i1:2227-2604(-)